MTVLESLICLLAMASGHSCCARDQLKHWVKVAIAVQLLLLIRYTLQNCCTSAKGHLCTSSFRNACNAGLNISATAGSG